MEYAFKRYFGLDLLRAIAIIFVFTSHSTLLLFPDTTNFILNLIRLMGAIGVDLFFILSGYLIGGILLKIISRKEFEFYQLVSFWKRRWMRTLPNYFFVLALNILIALILGNKLPDTIVLYSFFLQNINYAHPDFFTEAWSLSIEEFAYIILPFFFYIVLGIGKVKNKKKGFLVITIVVILLLTILKYVYYVNADVNDYKSWSLSYRKVVIYRLDSIYYGFILVFLIKKYYAFVRRNKFIFLFVGVLLFALLHGVIILFNLLPETDLSFYTFVYLQCVIFSLSMVFPYFLELNFKGKFNQLITFISTRSYSIYLLNYSLVLLNLKELVNVFNLSVFGKSVLLIVFILITIILAELLYAYFEKPILEYRDRKFSKRY